MSQAHIICYLVSKLYFVVLYPNLFQFIIYCFVFLATYIYNYGPKITIDNDHCYITLLPQTSLLLFKGAIQAEARLLLGNQ